MPPVSPTAENRLGPSHLRDFRQALAPESFPDFAQSGAFGITEPQPRWRVRPQHSVLGRETFDLQQQFLIDQPGHVCQQASQLNSLSSSGLHLLRPLILNHF